ncbi:73_t:CDS:1, partial [Ambispora gerdemannii]
RSDETDMVGIVKYLHVTCERIGYRDRNRFSTENRFSSTFYDDDDDSGDDVMTGLWFFSLHVDFSFFTGIIEVVL